MYPPVFHANLIESSLLPIPVYRYELTLAVVEAEMSQPECILFMFLET